MRRFVHILATLILTLAALPVTLLTTQAQDATPGAATPVPFSDQVFAGEGFVGEVQNVPTGEAFVAVVLAKAEDDSSIREVRALLYGDGENELQEWFPGAVTGDHLDLVSEHGARLQGTMSDDGASGTITLTDGTMLDFTLEPATGVAGLYTAIVQPGERIEGTSERGAKLEAELHPDPTDAHQFRATGTMTSPDDVVRTFDVPAEFAASGEPLAIRLIVLADGRMRGGAKRDDGGQYTCRDLFP